MDTSDSDTAKDISQKGSPVFFFFSNFQHEKELTRSLMQKEEVSNQHSGIPKRDLHLEPNSFFFPIK